MKGKFLQTVEANWEDNPQSAVLKLLLAETLLLGKKKKKKERSNPSGRKHTFGVVNLQMLVSKFSIGSSCYGSVLNEPD